jgi:hypothetical protein
MYLHWFYVVSCLFPNCPLGMVPRLVGCRFNGFSICSDGIQWGHLCGVRCIFSNCYCTHKYVDGVVLY